MSGSSSGNRPDRRAATRPAWMRRALPDRVRSGPPSTRRDRVRVRRRSVARPDLRDRAARSSIDGPSAVSRRMEMSGSAAGALSEKSYPQLRQRSTVFESEIAALGTLHGTRRSRLLAIRRRRRQDRGTSASSCRWMSRAKRVGVGRLRVGRPDQIERGSASLKCPPAASARARSSASLPRRGIAQRLFTHNRRRGSAPAGLSLRGEPRSPHRIDRSAARVAAERESGRHDEHYVTATPSVDRDRRGGRTRRSAPADPDGRAARPVTRPSIPSRSSRSSTASASSGGAPPSIAALRRRRASSPSPR